MDNEGVDPSTSRMLSVRSTSWANRPKIPTCWDRTSYPLITKVHILPLQSNALPNELKSVPIIIGAVSLSIFIFKIIILNELYFKNYIFLFFTHFFYTFFLYAFFCGSFYLCSATSIWDRRVFDEIHIDEALENNLEFDTLMIN